MKGRSKVKAKTTPIRITLTDPELLYLSNIRKSGSFRSDSETIGEVLRFVQNLRDSPHSLDVCLEVFGPRFGISVVERS